MTAHQDEAAKARALKIARNCLHELDMPFDCLACYECIAAALAGPGEHKHTRACYETSWDDRAQTMRRVDVPLCDYHSVTREQIAELIASFQDESDKDQTACADAILDLLRREGGQS